MEARDEKVPECHCIIRHAVTAAERNAVAAALERAREQFDREGFVLALAQLSGPCPARRPEPA